MEQLRLENNKNVDIFIKWSVFFKGHLVYIVSWLLWMPDILTKSGEKKTSIAPLYTFVSHLGAILFSVLVLISHLGMINWPMVEQYTVLGSMSAPKNIDEPASRIPNNEVESWV